MTHNNRGQASIVDPARKQYGVFSRAQARRAGFSERQIDYRLSTGEWETALPGVYRIAGMPSSVRQRIMAAVLWAGDGAVASHRAAGVLWGLDGVRVPTPELTSERNLRNDRVVVHRSVDPVPAPDRDVRYGIPVTSAARTLIDLASVIDGEALETALEDALRRRLTSVARLEWRLEQLGRRHGTATLLKLLSQRQNRPLESRLEVRFERLLRMRGLPLPERQRVVKDAHGRHRVDFAYPEHRIVVECVSWRYHSGQKAWRADLRRRRRLAAQGWRVLEFTWSEISWEPEMVIADLGEALAYASSSSLASSNSAYGSGTSRA